MNDPNSRLQLSESRCDVCVIGGGVVGLSVAYHLLKNDYSVVLLEKGDIVGCEASSGNGGTTLPFNQLLNEPSMYDYVSDGIKAHWRLVNSGLKYDYRKIGCLFPFYEEKERLDLEKRLTELEGREKHVSLTKEEIREIEPDFRIDIRGGILFPDCAHGESYKLCATLESACEEAGLVVRTSCEAKSFMKGERRILSAISNQSEISADYFIITTGAWSSQISDAVGFGIPTIPILGHMLTWRPERKMMSNAIWTGRGVLLPGDGNDVRMGGGMDYSGFDKTPRERTIQILSSSALRAIPSLEGLPHKIWTGLRPGTPDGLPIVGKSDLYKNLIVATGHYHEGFTLGPITGEIVSELIQRGYSDKAYLKMYEPGRFNC